LTETCSVFKKKVDEKMCRSKKRIRRIENEDEAKDGI
jgi:hypothetical protein